MLKKFITFMTISSALLASPAVLAAVMADQVGGVTIAPAQNNLPEQYQNQAPTRHAALTTQQPVHLAESEHTGLGYYFTSEDDHPYVGTTLTYEYFQTPDVGMGSQGTSGIQSKARYTAKLNRLVLIPTVYTGYHFTNHFLPVLFGEHANVQFNFSWFNAGEGDRNNTERSGATWLITKGAGPGAEPVSTRLRNFNGSLGMQYRNASLYFIGDNATSSPHLKMSPFIGLDYTYFQQNYNTSVWYSGSNSPDANWYLNKVNENVTTHYFGFGFGNNLTLKFTQHFQSMLDLGVQLLYADSHLDATQRLTTPDRGFNNPLTVKNDNNKLTYRAQASLGFGYNFTTSDASPVLGLNLGVDRWGYVAEVKNPRGSAETKKARIIDNAEYNPFIALSFHLPLMM